MSLALLLAEIPYPRIDPVIIGPVRWYGVSYIAAFGLAFLVLRDLARRGRWPVHPDRVADVLFWGILGVFLGGRIGYMAFYAENKAIVEWVNFRQGGMSFHGGMTGVVLAYFIYAIVNKIPFRHLGDGLALATPLGIASVRLANFINAELWGRPWDGPWAMRFPVYKIGETWDGRVGHRAAPPEPALPGAARGARPLPAPAVADAQAQVGRRAHRLRVPGGLRHVPVRRRVLPRARSPARLRALRDDARPGVLRRDGGARPRLLRAAAQEHAHGGPAVDRGRGRARPRGRPRSDTASKVDEGA